MAYTLSEIRPDDQRNRKKLLTLLEGERAFQSPAHERAFILRCAINASKDLLKSSHVRRTAPLEAAERVAAPAPGELHEVWQAVERLPDRERGFFDKTDAHDPSIVNRENSAVPGTPAEGKAQYGGGTAREFHPLPRKCAAQYAIVYATVYRTGTFFASPFGSVRKTYLRYRRS